MSSEDDSDSTYAITGHTLGPDNRSMATQTTRRLTARQQRRQERLAANSSTGQSSVQHTNGRRRRAVTWPPSRSRRARRRSDLFDAIHHWQSMAVEDTTTDADDEAEEYTPPQQRFLRADQPWPQQVDDQVQPEPEAMDTTSDTVDLNPPFEQSVQIEERPQRVTRRSAPMLAAANPESQQQSTPTVDGQGTPRTTIACPVCLEGYTEITGSNRHLVASSGCGHVTCNRCYIRLHRMTLGCAICKKGLPKKPFRLFFS